MTASRDAPLHPAGPRGLDALRTGAGLLRPRVRRSDATVSAALRGYLDRWLFRVGPAEQAPIVLVQRRIFVLPTRAGLAFAAALLPMLLASINYGLSLGYALTFLLAGIGIASTVHAFRNLLHLEIRPGRAEAAFCGTPAEFHLLISNPRNERRPALRLKTRTASAVFDLPAGDTGDVTLHCPTARRGWMPLGRVVIETTWPLGLVRAWSVLVPQERCLVYPTPEADPPPLPEGPTEAAGRPLGRSGEDDFAGLRAHRAADSPRHVAWKVVARGGPLLTKQFSGADAGELRLDWADLPAHMDAEARLARLTAWVLAAEAQGRAFSFSLSNHTLPTAAGTPHCKACLRQLALHGIADEHR